MNRVAALLLAFAIAFAQGPVPQSAPNSVIRIDVNLVQVDAVVTDSKDRRVTDLPATAFEIWQDGKPQVITNFSYISTKPQGEAAIQRVAQTKAKGEAPPYAPAPPGAEVRRTFAFVVDDMGLAAENVPSVRSAIRKFVDDEMRPADLVAVVRAGAGMGALQQFTTDKRLLYAALDRVKYGESRVGLHSFAPLGSGMRGTGAVNHLREDTLTVGSLGAIRFVVNTMRDLPGRKSVILFTENIRMIFRRSTDEQVAQAVRQLTDAASRAAVVIHAIEPRGVIDYNLTAVDNTSRSSRKQVSRVATQREQQVAHTQEGMFELAEKTGGLFLRDTNDFAGALRKAAEDSDGYYLIGYHPESNTFENGAGQARFHKIDVKVKGSGLHVRSRDGFFGEPGSGTPTVERTREAQLAHTLQAPFATGAIHPRLTAIFSNQRETGSFINALLYIHPSELRWSREPDGNRKSSVDVAAVAFDENGLARPPIDTTFPLRLNPEKYDDAFKKGLVYSLRIPVNKPGPYLVRMALRDPATESRGSAEQYVEVPDIESGHLALSGILLNEAAARRSFQRGDVLMYTYEIINAKSVAVHPELEAQTRLFRDGQEVMAEKTMLKFTAVASDPTWLRAGGRVILGRDMAAGQYVLQVIVTDKLAKNKFTTATQSMDFEIEP